MPKALQWGLLVFFICALVASMAIASVTLFLFWEHNRPRNYLFYRIADGAAATVPHSGEASEQGMPSGTRLRTC
jgi:hypothetical protein